VHLLRRELNKQVVAGADTSGNSPIYPFENFIYDIKTNHVTSGYRRFLPNGDESKLLAIDKLETVQKMCSQEPYKLPLEKILKKPSESDELVLNNFLEPIIKGLNFDNLAKKINDMPSLNVSDINQFIIAIKNGAFFKAWADHYTKQAQEMYKSLGLTT
jgi:hypothetical protein